MSKIRLFIAVSVASLAVPAIAFAAHAANCCGNLECCLRHLGCC